MFSGIEQPRSVSAALVSSSSSSGNLGAVLIGQPLLNHTIAQRIALFSSRSIRHISLVSASCSTWAEVVGYSTPLLLKNLVKKPSTATAVAAVVDGSGQKGSSIDWDPTSFCSVLNQAAERDIDWVVTNLLLYCYPHNEQKKLKTAPTAASAGTTAAAPAVAAAPGAPGAESTSLQALCRRKPVPRSLRSGDCRVLLDAPLVHRLAFAGAHKTLHSLAHLAHACSVVVNKKEDVGNVGIIAPPPGLGVEQLAALAIECEKTGLAAMDGGHGGSDDGFLSMLKSTLGRAFTVPVIEREHVHAQVAAAAAEAEASGAQVSTPEKQETSAAAADGGDSAANSPQRDQEDEYLSQCVGAVYEQRPLCKTDAPLTGFLTDVAIASMYNRHECLPALHYLHCLFAGQGVSDFAAESGPNNLLPTHVAASHDAFAALRLLVSLGVPVTFENQSGGSTALHIAAANGNSQMVRWLVQVAHKKFGIQIGLDATNAMGQSPRTCARLGGCDQDIVAMLPAVNAATINLKERERLYRETDPREIVDKLFPFSSPKK